MLCYLSALSTIAATPPTCVPSVLFGEWIFSMRACGAAASGDDEKKIVRLKGPYYRYRMCGTDM